MPHTMIPAKEPRCITSYCAKLALTLILSDYKYALAAIPLAVEPIQNIRFIPYVHARFNKYKAAYAELFRNKNETVRKQ